MCMEKWDQIRRTYLLTIMILDNLITADDVFQSLKNLLHRFWFVSVSIIVKLLAERLY